MQCVTVQRRHWGTCSTASCLWLYSGHEVKGERIVTTEGTTGSKLVIYLLLIFKISSKHSLQKHLANSNEKMPHLAEVWVFAFVQTLFSGIKTFTDKRLNEGRAATHRSAAGPQPGGWASGWTGTASPGAAAPWGRAPGGWKGWWSPLPPVSGGQCLEDGSFWFRRDTHALHKGRSKCGPYADWCSEHVCYILEWTALCPWDFWYKESFCWLNDHHAHSYSWRPLHNAGGPTKVVLRGWGRGEKANL